MRERIQDGALRAAEEHGFRHLTMDLVARYAGVARVTIYGHYANKDAVVRAVVARELTRILAALAPIPDAEADPFDQLVALFVNGYEWLRDHALLQRLIRTEPETILPYAAYDSPFLAMGVQRTTQWMAAVFGATGKAYDASDFEDAAELSVRMTQSLLLSPVSRYDLTDTEAIRTLAWKWLAPVIAQAADVSVPTMIAGASG